MAEIAAPEADTTFKPLGWFKWHHGVIAEDMCKIVVANRCRVKMVPGFHPQFCVEDVLAFMKEAGIERPIPRKRVRRKATSAAKSK